MCFRLNINVAAESTADYLNHLRVLVNFWPHRLIVLMSISQLIDHKTAIAGDCILCCQLKHINCACIIL